MGEPVLLGRADTHPALGQGSHTWPGSPAHLYTCVIPSVGSRSAENKYKAVVPWSLPVAGPYLATHLRCERFTVRM